MDVMQGFIPTLFETLILILWHTYLKGQREVIFKLWYNISSIWVNAQWLYVIL